MIQLIRGFKDILPGETECWQHIEEQAVALFEAFGFKQIRVPVMERTELFARSIGELTDIVEKEMYTFTDRDGTQITLRPEATAAIVRAYVQHKLHAADPVQKYYTIGPMFRRERPQKGRYRQFYQINAEVMGVASPLIDAQLIYLLATLLQRLDVTDVMPHVNSLGCAACRPAFRQALAQFLEGCVGDLCEDCRRRRERNPLRILDCKVPSCRQALTGAPIMADHLCKDCRCDFDQMQQALSLLGVSFVIDVRLVRGLDYYVRTTFEIQTGALGAQSAVAGGGRYDGLIQALGGPALPATGFAIGFDRLAEIVGQNRSDWSIGPQIYLAAMGDAARLMAFQWSCALGKAGVRVEMDLSDRGLKGMLKRADRLKARKVVILGENERADGVALVRDMRTKQQETLPIQAIVDRLIRMSESAP